MEKVESKKGGKKGCVEEGNSVKFWKFIQCKNSDPYRILLTYSFVWFPSFLFAKEREVIFF